MPKKTSRGHLLSDERVYSSLGISRSTFYRLIEKGVISVPPARIGKNRRGWTLADINLARQELLAVKEPA